jgi:3-deoxy-D-manno-octulosonic-acid transferase
MRWLYTALFYLLVPAIVLRLLWRSRRAPAYRRRICERFGWFGADAGVAVPGNGDGIWVHAVSVGETIAAAPMIRRLQERYPAMRIVVTTMTPTGSERVRALFGDSVDHVYAPYDVPDCIARFLNRTRPQLAIIVETELWPNTIHACALHGIPLLVANARLSARSARGYRRLRALSAPMVAELTRVVAQHAADGERFVELGLPRERLRISGSIKFDITLEPALRERAACIRDDWGADSLIWISASTHEGEESIALEAHRRLRARHPDALLVLVPRHPERFAPGAALVEQHGLGCLRRSAGQPLAADTAVLLGDTIGELLCLYGCADIAFVGGSLIPRGGHNMLEPAAWGLPLITGLSDYNFREISALLTQADALAQVADVGELAAQLLALAVDPGQRGRCGAAARQVVDSNRGALDKLMAEIEALLPG